MPIDHTLPPPRAGAAMLYVDIINGVIVLNGATVSGNFLDDMYLYSLSLDDWENLTGDQVFPAGRIAGSVSGSGDTLTIYGGASVFLTEERLLGCAENSTACHPTFPSHSRFFGFILGHYGLWTQPTINGRNSRTGSSAREAVSLDVPLCAPNTLEPICPLRSFPLQI